MPPAVVMDRLDDVLVRALSVKAQKFIQARYVVRALCASGTERTCRSR